MSLKKILLVLVPVSLIGTGFYMKNLESGKSNLVPAILENLKYLHYKPVEINDDFSKKVFDEFLSVIDGGKRFFTQEDINKLSIYKTKIDDFSKEGSYEFYDQTMAIYEGRINQYQVWFRDILSKPMEFESDENFIIDEKQPYAKDETELKDRLRKSMKYAVMTRLASSIEAQESLLANKDTVFTPASQDTLEA